MEDSEKTGIFGPAHMQPDPVSRKDTLPAHIGRYRLQKILGQGAFGIVYLAHDDTLERLVAIKVPHHSLVAEAGQADAYVAEARTVANLDHPHIVPVHDVGRTEQFPCFIVSKYIDGSDLLTKLKHSRFTVQTAVELVATVAEALHHAHKQGLVHRDIKPGNILLDQQGKPFVADFGMALREEDVGKGPRFAGTPAYMSPEQARGEGHRVDGRSDIFSLGLVFYQLLVGRLPFRGKTSEELLDQIANFEPRPPRQCDDNIPKELDRICLKALSKRTSERYSTAKDMADDLRSFLSQLANPNSPQHHSVTSATVLSAPVTMGLSGSFIAPIASIVESLPIKIVPKGLRSFDTRDADFFLELLPGPRDQGGLPDSIRFWKSRLEETDSDQTFAVGLIYGPSGCGKSSLVKAGLLPRLSDDLITIYVEATASDTESRLLNGLRKRCSALAHHLTLKESLAALRRGQGLSVSKKVVVIIDQFEQWLHANKGEQHAELVQALRQCDGGHVQCIIMVRDDFWLAVSRFLRDLEIHLLEGQNSALADLFDEDHARKVLGAFGRAFGKFAEKNKEHEAFVKQAVAGLAEEGKVICVRLALFAEMMKGKSWTPATLKQVGGTEGVGITFLEDTFSAATAPPQHRYHQRAARNVLRALLPDSGTDIKGHMRSQSELLVESGYGNRPSEFEDLIRILDGELRLITPTDPDGKIDGDDSTPAAQSAQKYYQLTHDYLVPSLRAWLTQKQKETRRGRVELLLQDRATVWNVRPENRQLPSLPQWFRIRWWTKKRNWTVAQQKMMRQASRYYLTRGALAAVILVAMAFGTREAFGRWEGRRLRDRLMESTVADIPGIVQDMLPYRRWLNPLLHDAAAQARQDGNSRKMLQSSLALLPFDSTQLDYLYERLLLAEPADLMVIRAALVDHKAELSKRLWTLLANPKSDQNQRLRAACVLSLFTPDDSRWQQVNGDVAATLVTQKPFVIAQWTEALKGAGRWLLAPLADFLVDDQWSVSDIGLLSSVYSTYARDLPNAYTALEQRLSAAGGPATTAETQNSAINTQVRIGLALMAMGQGGKVWPLLKHGSDPTLRSELIEQLSLGGVDPKLLLAGLDAEYEPSTKRAILLSLGQFGVDHLSLAERRNRLSQLIAIYRDAPDAGMHGAAEWLLRQWQATDDIQEIDKHLATGKVEGSRQWYLNRQRQTMIVISKPDEFWMGKGDKRHRMRLGRSLAIASKEVTIEQFLRFRKAQYYTRAYAPTNDCPILEVSWYDAAAYCNWLSEQESIPREQWCYVPNSKGLYAAGMTTASGFLSKEGYRLPTEAEWEYACRAGAETAFAWGRNENVLGSYAWIKTNSSGKNHPVGSLKPNDLGLFDMHGNLWEWCQDLFVKADDSKMPPMRSVDEIDDRIAVDDKQHRVLRGGSHGVQPPNVHAAFRYSFEPTSRNFYSGFRVARTLGASPK